MTNIRDLVDDDLTAVQMCLREMDALLGQWRQLELKLEWRTQGDSFLRLNSIRPALLEHREALDELGRKTQELSSLINKIQRNREEIGVEPIAVMVDIAVSLAAAGGYDGIKAIAKSQMAKRRGQRTYSEAELTEQAQRALAMRLSADFDQLIVKSIEISGENQAVADFRVRGADSYRVSIEMIDGVAVITRIQHEIRKPRFSQFE